MIKVPTVFVLGAGASQPFGFPAAVTLVDRIIENLNDDKKCAEIFNAIPGATANDVYRFKDQLFKSSKFSVDAFLEHRPEFIEIGKYAIAQVLIRSEIDNSLFSNGNWYRYLYNKLNTSFEDFGKNEVSVITFNYDRSFEHFLFTALKNSYGESDDNCTEVLNKIKIIHVHGQLGCLPWQSKTKSRKYSYNGRYTDSELDIAASEIRIIHEDIDIDNDPPFRNAQDLLSKATRVYFLGFGYDKTNISRLRLPKGKSMCGTAYMLEQAETNTIRTNFNSLGINLKMREKDVDSLMFLRKYVDFDN